MNDQMISVCMLIAIVLIVCCAIAAIRSMANRIDNKFVYKHRVYDSKRKSLYIKTEYTTESFRKVFFSYLIDNFKVVISFIVPAALVLAFTAMV